MTNKLEMPLEKFAEAVAKENKYDNLIKYAEEKPYTSIPKKIRTFLSKLGLKFRVFFKIKGKLTGAVYLSVSTKPSKQTNQGLGLCIGGTNKVE